MSSAVTPKELSLLIAILKSTGGIKPSWTKIQEDGLMPEGLTATSAAQVWFYLKKKHDLDGSNKASTMADGKTSPVKKRVRTPKKPKEDTEDGEGGGVATDEKPPQSPTKKRGCSSKKETVGSSKDGEEISEDPAIPQTPTKRVRRSPTKKIKQPVEMEKAESDAESLEIQDECPEID